jgi:predicted CXXCH cytochrome family protein
MHFQFGRRRHVGATCMLISPFDCSPGQGADQHPSSLLREPLMNIASLAVAFFIALFVGPAGGRRWPVEPLIKWILAPCLLFGLTASRLSADQHPVPLNPKADTAQCIQCHADKTKGKFVHEVVSTGCLTCHVIRKVRDTTRVNLKTPTPATLCFQCHADKQPAQNQGRIHPPAVRDCLTCHDPHTSANEDLLIKPTSGATAKENLCLSCHSIGVDVFKGGSRHLALDMGCGVCHSTHKVGDPTKPEFAYHLTKDIPELCLDCHDAKDPTLATAHGNQPFATANCTQCHAPHESPAPKLAQKVLHPPYADKSCDMCHQPAKDGKVVLTTPDVNSLCQTCHADQAKEIQTAKVQHPGAMGDCTQCHSPHAGRSPGLLQSNPVAVCLTCHSDLAEQGKKAHLHQPAFAQDCSICHTPHGGENARLLRVRDIDSLCLECHGPKASPQPAKGEDLVSIFDGKVALPKDYFRQVPILPVADGRGHPTDNHPISALVNIKGRTPFAMNCLSCHQPHASLEAGLLVGDQQPNMAFCTSCHTEGTLGLP